MWVVTATLGITPRQVYRLERTGQLRPYIDGVARLYGLDEVRRLARQRRVLARKDSRVSAPPDEAIDVLDGLRLRHDVCNALGREGMSPEAGFWQFVVALNKTGRPVTPSEWKLIGTLADLAMRAKGHQEVMV
jgi:hypothetical protein